MVSRAVALFFVLFFSIASSGHAGWPEDGCEGVPSLSIAHPKFDELHQLLAQEEEKVTRLLAAQDTTNIVLASLSFVKEDGNLHTCHFKTTEGKWLVFESGWKSSFLPNPIHDEAQRLMRPYASALQREDGLPRIEREKLVHDCTLIARHQRYFEEEICPNFHFFEEESLPAGQVLERAGQVFAAMMPTDPARLVGEELIKNRDAFRRVSSGLQTTRLEAGANIRALSAHIDPFLGVTQEILKDLGSTVKASQEKIAKQERELAVIGSKVVATYWHSEQKFLKFIEELSGEQLDALLGGGLSFSPKGIFLNFHSRHDICPVCSHAIVRSYSQPHGILRNFCRALCGKLGVDLPLFVTSSFREKRARSTFSLRPDQPERLTDLGLAFPSLHLPIPTQFPSEGGAIGGKE